MKRWAFRVVGSLVVTLWLLGLGTMRGLRADVPVAEAPSPAPVQVAHSAAALTDAVTRTLLFPYAASSGKGLEVVDQVGGLLLAIAPADPWLYVVRGSRFQVVDVMDPARPVVVGQAPDLGCATTDMDAADHIAYLACGTALVVVDARDPGKPRRIGALELGTRTAPESVRVSDGLVAIAGGSNNGGVQIVDVHDPYHPRLLGATADLRWVHDIALLGHYVLCAAGEALLAVVDIADPSSPRTVYVENAGTAPHAPATGIDVSGNVAILAQGDTWRFSPGGVLLYDVSAPEKPVRLGALDPPASAQDVRAGGSLAWVTYGDRGMSLVDLTNPAAPRLIGRHTTTAADDVRIDGTRVYVMARDTVEILDVTQPASPGVPGTYELPADGQGDVREVALHDGYVFGAAAEDGLRVIDARDPGQMRQVARVDTTGWAADAAWMSGSVFVADSQGGIIVIDAMQPDASRIVSVLPTANPVTEIAAQDGLVYAGSQEGDLWILDGRAPGSLRGIAHLSFPPPLNDIAVSGGYAYVAIGGEGIRVIDVRVPENPTGAGLLPLPTSSSANSVSSVTVLERYAYVMLGPDAMLAVADIADPSAPRWLAGQVADGDRTVAAGGRLITFGLGEAPNVYDLQDPAALRAVVTHDPGQAVVAAGVEGDRLYTFATDTLLVVDLAGVAGPRWLGRISSQEPGYVADVAGEGMDIFVLENDTSVVPDPWAPSARLLGYNDWDPAAPAVEIPLTAPFLGVTRPHSVQVLRDRLYISNGHALGIYDLGSAGSPRYLGTYDTGDHDRIVAAGWYAYAMSQPTGGRAGLTIFDVSDPDVVNKVASWSAPDAERYVSLAVSGATAYVSGVRTVVNGPLVAHRDTLWIVDVVDPTHPRTIAQRDGGGFPVPSGDLLVLGLSTGIEILDVTDPSNPRTLATLPEGALPVGQREDLVAHGPILSVAGRSGVALVDISTPSHPRLIASAPVSARQIAAGNQYLYVGGGERGLVRLRLPWSSQ